MQKKRIYYLDILRVIACLAVIMIHSSCDYVMYKTTNFNFWVGDIFDGFARIGVPLFVMISGTLLLDEKYDYSKEKLIKHIKKMIMFFVFWSFIYCLLFNIIGQVFILHKNLSISKIINAFVQGYYHLWYIYLIIGLYLILPLLRLWVNNKNKKYVEYFIVLSMIFNFLIPQLIIIGNCYGNAFIGINDIICSKLCLQYVGGFTTYFILGWYINNYEIKHKKLIYLLGTAGVLISIIGTYILETGFYGNLSLNVLLYTSAIFIFVKNIKVKENKLVLFISKYSLGIYAIHAIFIYILNKALLRINFTNALINIPVVFILTFILSTICAYMISKIPFLKKFV